MIKITKGLDLPIAGAPQQQIHDGPALAQVALLGGDYVGLRPTMLVREGEQVRKGQPLFEDKKNPGVYFTAPAAGEVLAINRGAKRALLSLVIRLQGDDSESFNAYPQEQLASLDEQLVRQQLQRSGLWTALRTRPFSKVPAAAASAHSIFINAMDTNPLAADPAVVLKGREADFAAGVTLLSRLTRGKVFVCKAAGSHIPAVSGERIKVHQFAGPHPAGLVGTHIHFLDPVGGHKQVWHLNYQDCAAIGQLFLTGTLDCSRVIALAGPVVRQPRLIRTQLGAALDALVANELTSSNVRVISGSVLNGATAEGVVAYLGRYHLQVSALAEGNDKEFLGWLKPGGDKFSVTRAFLSHLFSGRLFNFTSTTGGSDRAMVPIGTYERVVPLDILPTLLLRDLLSGDVDGAQQLGVLELDEEDLALCTFVCPGKYEYGTVLRACLNQIEKEG